MVAKGGSIFKSTSRFFLSEMMRTGNPRVLRPPAVHFIDFTSAYRTAARIVRAVRRWFFGRGMSASGECTVSLPK
jgi:hypothetical protein